MSWSGRDEGAPCCEGLGSVEHTECVCRIIIKRTKEPLYYSWFARADLYPPEAFSNECGTQDGLSVDRSRDINDEEIGRRSADRAATRPNRIANGGLEAEVDAIRSIERFDEESPAFKVYDDPLDSNQEHAVIRGVESAPEEDRSLLIDELESLFSRPRGNFLGH